MKYGYTALLLATRAVSIMVSSPSATFLPVTAIQSKLKTNRLTNHAGSRPGVLNTITSLTLLILSTGIVFALQHPLEERVQLIFPFSVGLILAAVSIVRVPQNFTNAHRQLSRTLCGSVSS